MILTVIVEVLQDFAPRTLCSRIRGRISFPHVFCFANTVLVSLEKLKHRYNSLDCNNYFSSPSWSAYHLLILLTTANFPDVMLPTYKCSGSTAWFFVVFLLVGLYVVFERWCSSFRHWCSSVLLYLGYAIDRHDTHFYHKNIT